MQPTSLIDALETAEAGEARRLLREGKGTPGVSQSYFERIVAYRGSSPDKALSLGAHWRGVAELGDNPAYAYRAKGVLERLRSSWLKSAEAFRRAGELAEDPVERLSFQTGAVDALALAGRMDQAEALADSLIQGLRRLGRKDLAARVMLNMGNALLVQDRMVDARRYLKPAAEELLLAGFEYDSASARMGLSTSHLYGGSPSAALLFAADARAAALEMGADHLAALCDVNRAHALLLMGRPDEALDLFLSLRESFEGVPGEQERVIEFAGDAYYRLNLWTEAIDAYREALGREEHLPRNNAANVRLGLGLSLVAAGRPSEALPHFRSAFVRYRKLGNDAWAAASLSARASALHALGRKGEARKVAGEAAALAQAAGSGFHWCEAVLSPAGPARSDAVTLRRAQRLASRHRFVGLSWKGHLLAGRQASGVTRLRSYRRMFEAILEGRFLTRSLTSRASYMQDKSDAVKEYLAELLARPSRTMVREALSVIERSRSVTLLDEIVSASSASLGPEALAQIEQLREELRELSLDEEIGGARRVVSLGQPLAHIQRRWVDATRSSVAHVDALVGRHATSLGLRGRPGTVVLAQAGSDLYALVGERSVRLGIGAAELERELQWLEYEMLAPLADRESAAEPAVRLLEGLNEALVKPWASISDFGCGISDLKGGAVLSVCPDGPLWRVPWSACLALMAVQAELLLHPSLGSESQDKLPANPRVLLWLSQAPDLRFASGEAARLLEQFPGASLCVTAEEARASFAGEYDLVHVIGHARHRRENPMFSSVEFTDGSVYAAEIARSGLKAGMVTLSACDTGALSVVSREEPDGLARAFLACGARSLVASAWPLDDEGASRAFAPFYDCLTSGGTVAQAMGEARQRVRAWRDHPYFWGALTLYRGYEK